MSVLCVSLIAGSIVFWQETRAAESSSAELIGAVRSIVPPSVPSGETPVTVGANTDADDLSCEKDGPSLVVEREKGGDRVCEVTRASLRRRSTEMPTLLWARTFSASLTQRHVRLQI